MSPQAGAADKTEHMEPDAVATPNCSVLSLFRPNTFDGELAQVQKTILELEKQEEAEIENIRQAEESKEKKKKEKAGLDKIVQRLKASSVKRNPTVQAQMKTSKTASEQLIFDLAMLDGQITKAKEAVKQIRAGLKKAEKEEASFKVLIAKAFADNEDDSQDTKPQEATMLETVFKILDRSSAGIVNKRDFIKGLENETVSSFFGLPNQIRQENGSRDRMESVFQTLATDGEFDLAALVAYNSTGI